MSQIATVSRPFDRLEFEVEGVSVRATKYDRDQRSAAGYRRDSLSVLAVERNPNTGFGDFGSYGDYYSLHIKPEIVKKIGLTYVPYVAIDHGGVYRMKPLDDFALECAQRIERGEEAQVNAAVNAIINTTNVLAAERIRQLEGLL